MPDARDSRNRRERKEKGGACHFVVVAVVVAAQVVGIDGEGRERGRNVGAEEEVSPSLPERQSFRQ